MTLLTGVIYPLLITGISEVVFPYRSKGSLIKKDGRLIGSELIGQKFDSSIYFWSRPSAIDYNPVPSGASNYGPTSKKLKQEAEERKKEFYIKNDLTDTADIPMEMIFASGSGLDPDITPESAKLQADRVARARNFTPGQKQKLTDLIDKLTEPKGMPLLGEKRINVLLLNIETDKIR